MYVFILHTYLHNIQSSVTQYKYLIWCWQNRIESQLPDYRHVRIETLAYRRGFVAMNNTFAAPRCV